MVCSWCGGVSSLWTDTGLSSRRVTPATNLHNASHSSMPDFLLPPKIGAKGDGGFLTPSIGRDHIAWGD